MYTYICIHIKNTKINQIEFGVWEDLENALLKRYVVQNVPEIDPAGNTIFPFSITSSLSSVIPHHPSALCSTVCTVRLFPPPTQPLSTLDILKNHNCSWSCTSLTRRTSLLLFFRPPKVESSGTSVSNGSLWWAARRHPQESPSTSGLRNKRPRVYHNARNSCRRNSCGIWRAAPYLSAPVCLCFLIHAFAFPE